MFKGFSKEAVRFMADIIENNNKEWFEAHKKIYLEEVYKPMKMLCEEVSRPFMKIDGMMSKAGRIYSDPSFPPYRKYRDNMYLIVKHECLDWSKTPSLFLEFSADGALLGLRLTHPAAGVMEKFRQTLAADDGELPGLLKRLERSGFILGGDDYKRPKPCPDEKLERYFLKRSLQLTVTVPSEDELLYSPELAKKVIGSFRKLLPLNEMFERFVAESDAEKAAAKEAAFAEASMPKAPVEDFMW